MEVTSQRSGRLALTACVFLKEAAAALSNNTVAFTSCEDPDVLHLVRVEPVFLNIVEGSRRRSGRRRASQLD